jgi:NhaP-type Na+/H+ and K+/H+ antiporter
MINNDKRNTFADRFMGFCNKFTQRLQRSYEDIKQHSVGISVEPEGKSEAIDKYFVNGRGSMEIELIERDDQYTRFNVTLDGKNMKEPMSTEIEVILNDNNKIINNPMETVNQGTLFFEEAAKSMFSNARNLKDIAKPENEGQKTFDFINMESVAKKVHQRIEKGMTHGFDYSNKMESLENNKTQKFSNPALQNKPSVSRSPSLSLSM